MDLSKKNQITAILITDQRKGKKIFSWCDQIIIINPSKDCANVRNSALKQATTRWVIFLSGREFVSPKLAKEIRQFITSADHQGYTGAYLIIKNIFLKKPINHGSWSPKKELRLGRRVGQWQENNKQIFWQFPGQKIVFSHSLIAKPYENLSQILAAINKKTTAKAQENYQKNQRARVITIIFAPFLSLQKNLFFRLGLLDGLAGLILAFLDSFEIFLEKGKLWLLGQKK